MRGDGMKKKTPCQERFVSIPQNPNKKQETDFDKEMGAHAERARVSGFIQLGYLCSIFAYEERYSAILPRLWEFFQAWDHLRFRWKRVEIQTETYEDRAGVWFWIFRKMAGINKHLSKRAISIPYLRLYDSETKEFKKEGPGRSDSDLVKLEDLKEYIENISKKLNIDFPLPPLLFPGTQEEKRSTDGEEKAPSFTPSPDFRSVKKGDKRFSLSTSQAAVIETLFEEYQRGTLDISQEHLLERAGSKGNRLRDLFKQNMEAWNNLIMQGKRKGLFRLNI
jgi:hypothetical protein